MEDIENSNMNSSLDNLYYACDHSGLGYRLEDLGLSHTDNRIQNLRDEKTHRLNLSGVDDFSVRNVCGRSGGGTDINSLQDEDIMMASNQLRDEREHQEYGETYTRDSPYSAETVSTPDKSGPYNENYHHLRDDSLVHSIYSEGETDPNRNIDYRRINKRGRAEDLDKKTQCRVHDTINTSVQSRYLSSDTRTVGVRSGHRETSRDQYNQHGIDETDSYRHEQHAVELRPLPDTELSEKDCRLSSGNRTHGKQDSVEGSSDSSRSSLPSSGDVKMLSGTVSGGQLSDRSPESTDFSLSTARDSSPEKISPLIPIHHPDELLKGEDYGGRKGMEPAETQHSKTVQYVQKGITEIPSGRKIDNQVGNEKDGRIWSSSSFSIHGDVYEEGRENLKRPTARMVRSHLLNRQVSLDYADEDVLTTSRCEVTETFVDSQHGRRMYSSTNSGKPSNRHSDAELEVHYPSKSRHSSGASSPASARDSESKKRSVNVPNFLQQQYMDSGISSDTGSPMDIKIPDNEQINPECLNSSRQSSGSSRRNSGKEKRHSYPTRCGSNLPHEQMDPPCRSYQTGSAGQMRKGGDFGNIQATRRMNRVESLPVIYYQQEKREYDKTRNTSEDLRKYFREKKSKSEDSISASDHGSIGFRPFCKSTNLRSSAHQLDSRNTNKSSMHEDKHRNDYIDRKLLPSNYRDSPVDHNTKEKIVSNGQPQKEVDYFRGDGSATVKVQSNDEIKTVPQVSHSNEISGTWVHGVNDRHDGKQEISNARQPTGFDGLHEMCNKQSYEVSGTRSDNVDGSMRSGMVPDQHVHDKLDMSSGRNVHVEGGQRRHKMTEKYRRSPVCQDQQERCQDYMQENMDGNIAKLSVGHIHSETESEYIDQQGCGSSNNSSYVGGGTVLLEVQPRETVKMGSDGRSSFNSQSAQYLTEDTMTQQDVKIDRPDMRQQLSERDERARPPEHRQESKSDRHWNEESLPRTKQQSVKDVAEGTQRDRGGGNNVNSEPGQKDPRHQGQSRYPIQGNKPTSGHEKYTETMDYRDSDTNGHYDDVFYDDYLQGQPPEHITGKQDRGYEARRQGQGHRVSRQADEVGSMVHVDRHILHGHADKYVTRHTVRADVHTNSSPVPPPRGQSRRTQYSHMSPMHGHSIYKQKPKYPLSRIQFDNSLSSKDYSENPDSLYPMREQHGGIQGAYDMAVLTSPEFLQSTGPIRAPIARPEHSNEHRTQKVTTDGPVSLQDPADMNSQDGGGQSEAKAASSSSQMHSSSASHSQASHAATNHSHSTAASEGQAQAQSQVNGSVVEDRKNLKNLPIEEVLNRTKAIVAELGKLEEYHRGEGMRLQKMLGDFYWDYTAQRQQIGDAIAEAGYAEITIKMLKSLNTIGIFKNDDVWFPAYYTYNTTWNYSDGSTLLAKNLAEADAVRLLTLNCSHKPYLTNIHSKNVYYVMKASMSILHNIARNPNVKGYFKENKTAEVVMPFINMNDDMLRVLAMLTLAYIVEEEDNSKLIDETGTIKNVVMWISKALDNPKRRFKGFTPQELTQGLDKLSVNDGNKPKIIEEGSIPLFMKMLQSENEKEQSTTARCIWTLAFDKDVRKQIVETENMMATLEKLCESQVKDVKKNAQGALWVLNGKGDAPTDRPRSAPRGKNHIFISYSWNEQEKVLEIRDRLRAEGYVVWVDVDMMGGSTLQAMAEAVENAAVVLVCMSEKYKQSPNCRTEAEYTFQLRKDYIPLMMQKKYRPDGWLGMILGAKLFFDFSGKYPFEKSASGLLKELRGRGKRSNALQSQTSGEVDTLQATADNQLVHAGNPHRNIHPGTELALPQGIQHQACLMSRDDVQRWLIAHQLDGSIAAFSQFDGRLLWQLREMKQEAPDYFYQCLEKKLYMNLIDMLRLASALDTLH